MDRRSLLEARPMPFRTSSVMLVGIGLFSVALFATLLVPAWHTGDRTWWPWTCAVGIVLGVLGYAYLRRGRGNAAFAQERDAGDIPA